MGFSGSYGPFPTNVTAGVYPVAQVRTSSDLLVSYDPATKLAVQTAAAEVTTNVLGGPQDVNPHAYLSFAEDEFVPEPSSYVLAALACGGLFAFRRRLRHARGASAHLVAPTSPAA